jgi:hypothetical protein
MKIAFTALFAPTAPSTLPAYAAEARPGDLSNAFELDK